MRKLKLLIRLLIRRPSNKLTHRWRECELEHHEREQMKAAMIYPE